MIGVHGKCAGKCAASRMKLLVATMAWLLLGASDVHGSRDNYGCCFNMGLMAGVNVRANRVNAATSKKSFFRLVFCGPGVSRSWSHLP